jgi:Fe-S-cluster-containing dehydrogenase component/DMSO reductase anchor subunit
LVDAYLREQRDLTAVERFSRHHDTHHDGDGDDRSYHDLIPLSLPKEGEQFSFHVDLDRCTGCKACVTACHSLNGLDEHETWRFVGQLHGGTPLAPVLQTVTTACHHCVDPACLNGCPVEAYEKDPVTGIVKHLDDQCIGCQYCTLTCPYEVPQYNTKKGIVRKCDMCSDRLAAGEAPACVQACPNEAISIRIVSQDAVLDDHQADTFLPGAPSPGITAPTTVYRSTKPLPRNTLPADFYAVRPSHQHRPLVVMLVLTQLSVGAFCIDWWMRALMPESALAALRPVQSLVALAVGLLALSASVFHLGRPLYAFRAFLNLKKSWMSREIVAFGAFAGSAVLYAGLVWRQPLTLLLRLPRLSASTARLLELNAGSVVALAGLAGVFCSVMLYHVTLRRFWNGSHTAIKFFGTALLLGAATTLVTTAACGWSGVQGAALLHAVELLLRVVMFGVIAKLLHELSILLHLADKQQTELKRSALLLVNDLRPLLMLRVGLGLLGGIALPLLCMLLLQDGFNVWLVGWSALGLLTLVAGELLERSLFFAAVSAPRMPGTFA